MSSYLKLRAATALDRTHMYGGVFTHEMHLNKVRGYLANYLDGKRLKTSFVLACCRYLEMVVS